MTSSSYATFFSALAVGSFAGMVAVESVVRWTLVWPAMNAAMLAAAYWLNRPEMLMGKTGSGTSLVTAINLPWLAVTWIGLRVWKVLSSENSSDQIGTTNIWVGRRPSPAEAASFDHIFDLTAEFPRVRRHRIECVPNLDGVPLASCEAIDLPTSGRVLVHCAQGHGRSATWLALQLVHNRICPDLSAALQMIEASRPGARPSRAQAGKLRAS